MNTRTLCSLFLVPLCIVLGVRSSAAQAAEPAGLAITGTLTFFGCTPSPEDFTISAALLRGATVDERTRDESPDDTVVVVGTLSRTADARTFAVTLPAVQSDAAYQLGIRPVEGRTNPCGRVFWEGPRQGIVFPGIPVRLVGYAPRAAIEVMGTQAVGQPRRGWVGADSVDMHDPANAIRQFRWRTEVPGITGGRIQVATGQFPKDTIEGRTCGSADGVVYEATFTARSGAWNLLPPLNMAAIARSIASRGPHGAAQEELLSLGAPLYVRVLPMVGGRLRCRPAEDGPAPWAVLADLAKQLGPTLEGGASGPAPKLPIGLTSTSQHIRPWVSESPTSGQTFYRTTKPHFIPHDILTNFNNFFTDPYAYAMAKYIPQLFPPGQVAPAGSMFLLWKGSSGFNIGDVFDSAVAIVTGVIDALGMIVDEVSNAYESIKSAVAEVITSAISATGLVNCEASNLCQQLVATAISSCLMAAGLPPSIPNWNAVIDHGYEYLAAEIVSQAGASTVPGAQELTKAAVKALVDEAVTQMTENRGGGGGLPDWLTIEIGQEPPVLILNLRTAADTTAPLFPDRLVISGNGATLGATVKVPAGWEETSFIGVFKSLKIPVVLKPNLIGFTPPANPVSTYQTALAAKTWWRWTLFFTPCVETHISLAKRSGFFLLPTHSLPMLSYDPKSDVWFNPTYQHCVP